jgi:putative membrane protein
MDNHKHTSTAPAPAALAIRSVIGGLLMGVANVVPGISGGAMLLMVGVYTHFIRGIAELSTLRPRARSLAVVGGVGLGAGIAILLAAGPVKELTVEYRWQTFSLFIGLRLGAIPIVWKLCERFDRRVAAGFVSGIVATAALAAFQYSSSMDGSPLIGGPIGFFLAGLIGASATILPGMDGSYFLLLMGKYVPILSEIDRIKHALGAGDMAALSASAITLAPVGVGVAIGIGGVSVAMRWLFGHYRQATAGTLLGVLVGAVGGLYPFRSHVAPAVGSTVRGVPVTADNLATFEKELWPLASFTPDITTLGVAIGLVVLGVVSALLFARLEPKDAH